MTPPAPRAFAPSLVALALAYLTNFGALAASTPFLALHLGAVGFAPAVAAQLLALLLLVRVVAVPGWTFLADRARSTGTVLRLVSAGALVAFVLLLLDPPRAIVAIVLLAFAALRAPFGPLLDALVLGEVRGGGRAFGLVRAWGTAGYTLGAMLTGALVARAGSRAVLYASVAFLAAALVASLAVPRGEAPGSSAGPKVAVLVTLVRRPRFVGLLVVALLQQIGLAPYDALFPAYLTGIAGASAAGLAITVGASAEFLFLLTGASLAQRIGPGRLLAVACAASVVRWAVTATTTIPAALIAIQALHAFGFGAFYVSAVMIVNQESPPSLRASGQGIFSALCFGVAAAIGLSLAGIVERHAGMRAVFGVGAAASFVATFVAYTIRPGGDRDDQVRELSM